MATLTVGSESVLLPGYGCVSKEGGLGSPRARPLRRRRRRGPHVWLPGGRPCAGVYGPHSGNAHARARPDLRQDDGERGECQGFVYITSGAVCEATPWQQWLSPESDCPPLFHPTQRTASELLREGLNPSGLEELVDRRPQGRNFLYAQCTSKGATMYRDGTLAAPPPSYQLPTRQTASLPALSFQAREFVGRKVPSEAIPTTRKLGNRQIPGYTGHIHGMQHVYGTSFGELSAALRASALDTTRSSLNLVGYGEFKPQAPPLQGEGERIPGYTGESQAVTGGTPPTADVGNAPQACVGDFGHMHTRS